MKIENSNKKLNIKIVIAAHKPYVMPQDEIYLPIQVGSEGRISHVIIWDLLITEDTLQ